MDTTEKFQKLCSILPQKIADSLRQSANTGAIHIANLRIENENELPQSLVDLWLAHDGQTGRDHYLFPNFAFLSLPQAIAEYQELCSLLRDNDPYYDDPDPYAPKKELWEKWFDPILFPIGWTPGGSGCLYLMNLENENIWYFNADGGLGSVKYESTDDLLQQSINHYQQLENGG